MKKAISLLLALVMVMSLAACGGGRTEPTAAPTEAAKTDAPAATEAAPASGIEEGAVIGVSLPWLGTQNWKEAEEMFKTELDYHI